MKIEIEGGAALRGAIETILGYSCHRSHHEIMGLSYDFVDDKGFHVAGRVQGLQFNPFYSLSLIDGTTVLEWRWNFVQSHWEKPCHFGSRVGITTLIRDRQTFV